MNNNSSLINWCISSNTAKAKLNPQTKWLKIFKVPVEVNFLVIFQKLANFWLKWSNHTGHVSDCHVSLTRIFSFEIEEIALQNFKL